ncbi:hypothetical protein AGABI1DRAFT_129239 [Agaricus bisporus var. burnettii JB137-S8]|uniref:Protein kinase domain-containing protein n=1 Tax=Agaricus bisporus var. burnettii (strain JB137-S8 / ATCC MYA-4627 / FGSC 10392) TaxID=597362 RepID=K5VWX2_AGABU|nr:uncharacterized protein AGABI1DRAFT_129239 [Agaricus bisporus var. burnettii JB137-S8]EKM78974.1 hypothetical protein AGABI1DRAFT_129239 [Agaricus bisporus var. burnettii JB137-S8]
MLISSAILIDQCYKVECDKCHKTTWKGCGKHVDAVMADVKEEERCRCAEKEENCLASSPPPIIGSGHHGEVFLCFRIDNRFAGNDGRQWFPVAMKSVRRDTVIDKYSRLKANRIALTAPAPSEPAVVDKLNTTELKIKKEIAIMKKLAHPNVVRLFEVIDDRMKEKVYMVMEYLGGGEIKWRNNHDMPTLTLQQTRRIIRDAVLGLEYLHYHGIIHRDIKPGNLLWTEDRHHVKIADFGVSHFSYAQRLAEAGDEGINPDELEAILMDESDLTRRAGTPAFLAPELIFEHFEEKNRHYVVSSLVPKFSSRQPAKPRVTKSIDVWALGVTLYCLLFGETPFLNVAEGGATEFALYRAICNKDWEVPELMCKDRVSTGGRHPKKSNRQKQLDGPKVISLLDQFLQKDQTKRITLDEVKRHQWITEDLPNPSEWYTLTSPGGKEKVQVTKADTFFAISSVPFRWGFGGFGKGMSALFKPLKPRSRTTSASVHYSSSLAAAPTSNMTHPKILPNRKSVAVASIQDVHAYGKTELKGKGKAVEQESTQPSSPGLSTSSSSPALDAIRRQRSQMGILGHEQREIDRLGDSPNPASTHAVSTPVGPAPKLEDILSIVTWRPTKYPTPTTSLRPLLANIHADGTSTFRSPPRSKRPHANVSIITPIKEAPARTASTLERDLHPHGDLLGMYGSDLDLGARTNVGMLNNFKRASSWGQGDEVSDMGAGSVKSVGGEVNETVKLLGAGGVESLGSPNSPITPGSSNSHGGSIGGGRATSGGSAGDMMGWDQLGEGIRKWRSVRKKHRAGSSSTLPWVESFEDMRLGAADPVRREGANRERRSRHEQSRGELTMDWMDDNYSTPGGYYGTSMGPATQFWRHGTGSWRRPSVSSSGEEDDGPLIVPSRAGEPEREVVRRREDSLGKFLSGGDSESEVGDDNGEGSENHTGSGLRPEFQDEGLRRRVGGADDDDDESECDSEDEHAQQITIKSRGSIRR